MTNEHNSAGELPAQIKTLIDRYSDDCFSDGKQGLKAPSDATDASRKRLEQALAASHCVQGDLERFDLIKNDGPWRAVRNDESGEFVRFDALRFRPADKPAGQAVTDAQIEAALDTKVGLDHTLRSLIRGDTVAVGWSKVDVVRKLLEALAPEPATAGDADEDAYVIERLSQLLAEIAIIVNGPEPELRKWSYHDLPEKVRVLKATPAAAVPDGWRDFIRGMSVSVDVSTNDDDAGNRIFGTITEVMDDRESKHGVILLVQDNVTANFAAAPANRPTDAQQAVPSLNFRGESPAEVRSVLVNSLVASKCWMNGYAEAYVDEAFATFATPPADPLLSRPAESVSNGSALNELSGNSGQLPAETPSLGIPEGFALVPRDIPASVLFDAGYVEGFDYDAGYDGDKEHAAWWKIAVGIAASSASEVSK